MRLLIIVLSIVLVSGCASSYRPPKADLPSAAISFEIDANPTLGYVASFFYFPNTEEAPCLGGAQRMAKINDGNLFAGKTTSTADISIPANENFVIRTLLIPNAVFGMGGCTVDTVINAQANRSYLLKTQWNKGACVTELFDLTDEKELIDAEHTNRPWC